MKKGWFQEDLEPSFFYAENDKMAMDLTLYRLHDASGIFDLLISMHIHFMTMV